MLVEVLSSSLSFSKIPSSRSPQFVLPFGLLPAYAPEEAKSTELEPLALSMSVAGLEPLALSMPEAETSLPLRTGLGPLSPPMPVSTETSQLIGVLLKRVS